MVTVITGNGKVKIIDNDGANYNGSKSAGDLDGWQTLANDPNDFLKLTYDELSKRSTTLYHTYGPAISAIDKQTDYAIGDGLYFRSQPDFEALNMTKEKAREWGKRFQKLIYYEFSRLNFYIKQKTLFTGALTAGDSLLYFLREDDGSLDLVDMPGTVIDSNKEEKNVTLGIIHDDFYRRKGFYDRDGKRILFKENERQNVAQFYLKKLPRQLRGYPLVYAIISLAKNDDRYNDAAIASAILESILVAFTETANPSDTARSTELANSAKVKRGAIGSALESIGNFFKMQPGNMMHFRPGEKVNIVDRKTPGNNYGTFKEWIINYIAMATGTPPEGILGKYSTSFTAHKGALNDFKKSYEAKREAFINAICYVALKEVATYLIQTGQIAAPGFFSADWIQRAYLSGIWLGPVPGHINPLQEVNAAVKAVDNALTLRSDATFNYSGSELDDIFTEWQRQEKDFRALSPDDQAGEIDNSLKGE